MCVSGQGKIQLFFGMIQIAILIRIKIINRGGCLQFLIYYFSPGANSQQRLI